MRVIGDDGSSELVVGVWRRHDWLPPFLFATPNAYVKGGDGLGCGGPSNPSCHVRAPRRRLPGASRGAKHQTMRVPGPVIAFVESEKARRE